VVLVMTACPTCGLSPCINPQFCASCRDADARKARGDFPRYIAPYLWRSPSERHRDYTTQPTLEALVFSLRERGTKALAEAPTKRRLSELSEQQLHQVCGRMQRLKPHIAPAWSAEQITVLVDEWNGCHG